MTLEAIQTAIKQLSEADRSRLADWLNELEEQAWDQEIERDFAPGGPGIPWLEEMKREIAEGQALPFVRA